MDLLYASIGKAIEITRGHEVIESSVSASKSSTLWTYVVASLTASYYNVIGPSAKSASSLANRPTSIIQNAWGMVSLPAVKKASLEATRILKGAAIADRIEICGGKAGKHLTRHSALVMFNMVLTTKYFIQFPVSYCLESPSQPWHRHYDGSIVNKRGRTLD